MKLSKNIFDTILFHSILPILSFQATDFSQYSSKNDPHPAIYNTFYLKLEISKHNLSCLKNQKERI